jgi:RHS repeat-associated protein
MKQEWGRQGYAGDWPSDRRVWSIAAFFVALASVAAICAYDYDRFGNRWHQNGPHSSSLGFDANNRIVAGSGVTYDTAGNATADGSHTYAYDAEGRVATVDGGVTATYVYDAEGRRVRKTTTGGSVDYLYDQGGHQVAEVGAGGVFNRGELYADGRHLATYSSGPSGSTFFDHTDWLGTERARTDMTGTACETITSLPFGDAQTTAGGCADVSPLHFTGKQRDPESGAGGNSGLDDFGARYFTSNMGRFMSPDEPLVDQDESNPQSWNLYSYVRDNPISNTDPSGQACVSDGNGGFRDDNSGGQTCAQASDPKNNNTPSAIVTAQADTSMLGDAKAFGLNAAIGLINLPDDFFDALTGLRANPHIPIGQGKAAAVGAFAGPFLFPEADLEDAAASTIPKMTRWGWTRTSKWLKAIKALRRGGTKEALEGIVPSLEEAKEMIKAAGGRIDREHTYPHVNYTTAGGQKATVRVQSLP